MTTIRNSRGIYFTLGSFDNDKYSYFSNVIDNYKNKCQNNCSNNINPLQEQTKLKQRKRMLWATNDTQDTSIFACIWDLLELNNIV